MKGWKIYQANIPPKQAGVAILISDKDFLNDAYMIILHIHVFVNT
jgi:hypothetical protein